MGKEQTVLPDGATAAPPVTTEDFASLVQYHPESVRRAIREGRIKALRFGQTWRIPASEVARILRDGLPA